jgi:phenylpyruvate tautomerase PptA (4-oxalocrotonate tautomerase family)
VQSLFLFPNLLLPSEKNTIQIEYTVPILEFELVESEATRSLPADLAQSLADAAAQVLGASKGTVWVKIRVIPSIQYAEDYGKPEGMFPAL